MRLYFTSLENINPNSIPGPGCIGSLLEHPIPAVPERIGARIEVSVPGFYLVYPGVKTSLVAPVWVDPGINYGYWKETVVSQSGAGILDGAWFVRMGILGINLLDFINDIDIGVRIYTLQTSGVSLDPVSEVSWLDQASIAYPVKMSLGLGSVPVWRIRVQGVSGMDIQSIVVAFNVLVKNPVRMTIDFVVNNRDASSFVVKTGESRYFNQFCKRIDTLVERRVGLYGRS